MKKPPHHRFDSFDDDFSHYPSDVHYDPMEGKIVEPKPRRSRESKPSFVWRLMRLLSILF